MIKGRVIGRVWSTKRVQPLPQGALLEVEMEDGGRLVAFDPLGVEQDPRPGIDRGDDDPPRSRDVDLGNAIGERRNLTTETLDDVDPGAQQREQLRIFLGRKTGKHR